MPQVAGSRAEVAAQIRTINDAFEELRRELDRHPLRSDISVCIDVAGATAYYITGGRLKLAGALSDRTGDAAALGAEASSSSSDSGAVARTRELARRVEELEGELERRGCDVRIGFRDESILAVLVVRARDAFEQNDLPRVLSAMLCEVALPTWGRAEVEVSGVSYLARLLWSAWLSRESDSASVSGEQQQKAREKSKQSWLDEDLSQGWVIVHSVSPGIRERVAVFQNELEQLQAPCSTAVATSPSASEAELNRSHWMDELVRDLREAAEQFHESIAVPGSCVAPSPPGSNARVDAGASAAPHGYGSCASAPVPVVASTGTVAAGSAIMGMAVGTSAVAASTGVVVATGLEAEPTCRTAPPRSSTNFL